MCGSVAGAKPEASSFGNVDEVIQSKLSLELAVDFDRKCLAGDVVISCKAVKEVRVVHLDVRLVRVSRVSYGNDSPCVFVVAAERTTECPSDSTTTVDYSSGIDTPIGSCLSVFLPEAVPAGAEFSLRVSYETHERAPALDWLRPEQTAGKQHPYLSTQCQAIHARSIVPCMDTPGCKVVYEAGITVPRPLVALMSAEGLGEQGAAPEGRVRYAFKQDIPIPTYLIALVVGALESRDIGPRSRVWSEASFVDAAAHEFEETEDFLRIGEELFGPYQWKRYDILVLPPSFPYGGMENPMITFVTPTLLAGDRSLSNVVAHEIAHSWFGNLVTNASWRDFFLNEGFTVFAERKIISRKLGEKQFDLAAQVGLKHLADDISHFGAEHEFTKLRPNLGNEDPDDAFSSVPYEKGFSMLVFLQSLVGEATLLEWLRAYLVTFQFKSVTAENMCTHFETFVRSKGIGEEVLQQVDWNAWFGTPGMPLRMPKLDTSLSDNAIALARQWVESPDSVTENTTAAWSVNQKLVFLGEVLDQLRANGTKFDAGVLERFASLYSLTGTRNSEIRFLWDLIALHCDYAPIVDDVIAFVTSQGRMKYVRPLYRALHASAVGGERAKEVFAQNRATLHPIAEKMVARDLGVA